MLFSVHDGAHTPSVVSSSGHAELADIKLDEVLDLASFKVEHDGIIHLQYTLDGQGAFCSARIVPLTRNPPNQLEVISRLSFWFSKHVSH